MKKEIVKECNEARVEQGCLLDVWKIGYFFYIPPNEE
jgi:hypothetical protein